MKRRVRLGGRLWLAILVLGAVFLFPPRAGAQGNLPPDLQALIAEALKANREVKKWGEVKAASTEAIRPAGTLDDPMLSFNLLNLPANTFAFDQEPMTQKQIMLSQKFPFPGKLRLRSEIAQDQARADDLYYQDKANEVRTRVIQGYWSLSLAYAAYDITLRNKQFWEQVVQVAETRYGVGQGQQSDVLQAQVELGNYLDRLLQWRQRQESIQADLNALRSQPPQTAIPRPRPLRPRSFYLKREELLELEKNRPQLQALRALVDKQGKGVDLARKDYYPDLTLGLAWGLREDRALGQAVERRPDFFSSTMMINVPLWVGSKLKPRVREQRARQAAAQEAYQSAWDRFAAAIQDLYAKLRRLSQQVELYQGGIVPRARQAAEASLAAYQVGTLDFARLYQDQIAAYNAELQCQKYLQEFEIGWAEMEWLVGQELPRRPGGQS